MLKFNRLPSSFLDTQNVLSIEVKVQNCFQKSILPHQLLQESSSQHFFLLGSIYLQEEPTHVSLHFRLIHICIEVGGPIFSDVCIYYIHKWKMEDLVSNDIFFEIGFCFRFLEAAQSQQSLTPKIYNATDQKDKTLYYQLIYISTPQNY